MARPVTISEEQILEAAKTVFLAKGLAATTADVAVAAGVSEGIIFKRFKTKADLFRAAMEHGMGPGLATFPDTAQMVGKGDIAENLFNLGTVMVEKFRTVIPVVMMSWSNSESCPIPLDLDGPEPMPVRAIKWLASYFDGEMRARRLRMVDPEVVARMWIGSLWHYVMIEVLVPNRLPLPAPTFLRGAIDTLLKGLEPPPAPPQKKLARKR